MALLMRSLNFVHVWAKLHRSIQSKCLNISYKIPAGWWTNKWSYLKKFIKLQWSFTLSFDNYNQVSGFSFSHGYYKHDKADKKKPCSNDKVNGQLFLCPSSFYVQSNFLNPWILQLKYKTDHYLLKIYLPIIIANLINFHRHNKTNVWQWNESRTWSHISFVIKNFLPIFCKRYCDNDKIEINYFKIPLFV